MGLSLDRHEGESICIGDDVVVSIKHIHGGRVRINIEAPKETKIWRKEIYDRIQEEKTLAFLEQEAARKKVGGSK